MKMGMLFSIKMLEVVDVMIIYGFDYQSVPTVGAREQTSGGPDGDQDDSKRLVLL